MVTVGKATEPSKHSGSFCCVFCDTEPSKSIYFPFHIQNTHDNLFSLQLGFPKFWFPWHIWHLLTLGLGGQYIAQCSYQWTPVSTVILVTVIGRFLQDSSTQYRAFSEGLLCSLSYSTPKKCQTFHSTRVGCNKIIHPPVRVTIISNLSCVAHFFKNFLSVGCISVVRYGQGLDIYAASTSLGPPICTQITF